MPIKSTSRKTMISRRLTSMKRKGGDRTRAKLIGKNVRIWSGEHRAWWRPEASGYTTFLEAAGIYSFEDAWRATAHCCRMKQISYVVASPAETNTPSWQFYRNGVIVPITEEEARHQFDGWRIRSCDRGAATLLIDQMWAEIDRLRAELVIPT